MSSYSEDTLRILVATDNHVGYAEDDPIRGDDGWKTFDEIMSLAVSRDVDMILLGGDLFHDHLPSRKSLFHVMESLRKHCLGNKPCAVEIIGDESEHFRGQFNFANYNDSNFNISIPVFSIHGNHDEPTGQDGLASLDILHTSGLINYIGRQVEADNITVRPLLMQKGTTKLALYGLSNVRDERLYQTFRSNKVKFLQPSIQKDEWYNLLAVHQNHTPHTDTSYLPETFLPSFMDMVIWGHEHQCKIKPILNEDKGFQVIQPGSSIATSLSPSEADPKHVCILNITGQECEVESIRLRTIRPFIYKDIALSDIKEMVAVAGKTDNLVEVKKYCKKLVDSLIKKANQDWLKSYHELGGHDVDDEIEIPLPLIRLRIEYSPPPNGGDFKVEQNRRFSKEYDGQVANDTDLFQFHRKRTGGGRRGVQADIPDDDVLAEAQEESRIGRLVQEYLSVQDLTLLPRNLFSDAVTQYVEKKDQQAVGVFLAETVKRSEEDLLKCDVDDDDLDDEKTMDDAMGRIRAQQEARFEAGELRLGAADQPRPDDWDSDEQGHWGVGADVPLDHDSDAHLLDSDDPDVPATKTTKAARGGSTRGRGRGGRGAAAVTTRKAPAAKKAPAKKAAATVRAKKKQPFQEDDDDEDDDVIMLDDDDDDDVESANGSGGLFVSQASSAPTRKAPARSSAVRGKPTAAASSTQTRLNFGSASNGSGSRASAAKPVARRHEPSDDEISDDDAFETPAPSARSIKRR